MSRRSILLLANNVEELGGVQRVVHLLAAGFRARGHDVSVIGMTHPVHRGIRVEGLTYQTSIVFERSLRRGFWPKTWRERLNVKRRVLELDRRRRRRVGVRRLSRLLRPGEPGFIICAQIYSMEHLVDADTSGKHVIAQYHGSYAEARATNDHRRALTVYRDADLFLLLTEHDAEMFERDGMNNVGVMHNPLSFYPEQTSALENKVVLTAGRYHQEKGLDKLLEAWALVAQRHPDWRLEMFGTGPAEAELRAQLSELGLESSAILRGPSQTIMKEYLASSIFVLSSRHEGLPMALGEAMACGVPCVSFDCAPGVREIITDGEDGLVVPHMDVAALADGICRLIEDEALRRKLGARARESVRRFELDRILDQWEEVFAFVER